MTQKRKSNLGIEEILNEYPELSRNGDKIKCLYCKRTYTYNPNEGTSNIRRHLNQQKHIREKENILRKDAKNCSLVYDENEDKNNQNDFVEFITKLNIPLSSVDSDIFKNFAIKHFDFSVKSSSHYRKNIIPNLYNDKIRILKDYYIDKKFYIVADSTTDALGRNILSIMIGECYENERSETHFLKAVELNRGCAANYFIAIHDNLRDFFDEYEYKNNFVLFLSDQANTMLACGRLLSAEYNNMKHFTCSIHMLHNVTEKMRKKSPLVDEFVVYFKKHLIKNKDNIEIFKLTTNLPLPKFPIIIRWATWLEFVTNFIDNYSAYTDFVKALDVKYKTNMFEKFNSDD